MDAGPALLAAGVEITKGGWSRGGAMGRLVQGWGDGQAEDSRVSGVAERTGWWRGRTPGPTWVLGVVCDAGGPSAWLFPGARGNPNRPALR